MTYIRGSPYGHVWRKTRHLAAYLLAAVLFVCWPGALPGNLGGTGTSHSPYVGRVLSAQGGVRSGEHSVLVRSSTPNCPMCFPVLGGAVLTQAVYTFVSDESHRFAETERWRL